MSLFFVAVIGALVQAQPSRSVQAQSPRPAAPDSSAIRMSAAVAGLTLRSLGPGLMSGRIADVAVHPTKPGTWYVAAGSGGIWKTTNAGTSWKPIFDDQPSFSIGEITLDPSNPDVVWVGTGENVSGRHVAWGDGVYRSRDGGTTWQRMGLPKSEHIGRILVDPRDSKVVLVAAEGPLWAAGGERGVYRSADGGATWTQTLQIDENTGVTDIEFDPSNPDVVYAAGYQRRRHVWGFLGGGPKGGIWKSADNGKTWRQIKTGLPTGDVGKIGLAVTPADPTLVYATIEAKPDERGFYRSADKGESWQKRNSYISGGTGPHYYQEIEASPVDPDVVYQMDVFMHVTRDGGRTFAMAETGYDKHSDNHALWINPANPLHLVVGTDAGLYESFDDAQTWRHFPNLPISQYYKVALNNRSPFYDILGGAQDLGTMHGPSRTTNRDGIRNHDWYVPLGADGYGVAFDPDDPDLLYLMWQEGNLYRKHRKNDEGLGIRPMPAPGDPAERWNWDSPILISPHRSSRIYYGSQRVWQSDDRGNTWTAISGDLTQGRNRYEQKFMGRVWSIDAIHDNAAMSKYATLTAITESPVQAGVLAVGTDDGLVQVSGDGGGTWTRAAAPVGLPAFSFVNDIEASMHDARTLYLAADNHKTGDFSPYLFESTDLGRTWRSIAGDLPKNTIVWAIQQDHVRPELLFAGTEFGLYVTLNRGTNWHKLSGGVPTISFRDLKLHRRDDDLVGATFGRGFYILDDYSPLRALAAGLPENGALFGVRDAWWYVPYQPGQAPSRPEKGTDDFTTPNPPLGAVFTYYLREVPTTARDARREAEKPLNERGADASFPGYERLRRESLESGPKALILIADATGRPVRWIEASAKAGIHRVSWDMRGPDPSPIDLSSGGFRAPWADPPRGPLVAPGAYTAELMVVSEGSVRRVGAPQRFTLKPVPNTAEGTDLAAVAAFQQETADLRRRVASADEELGEVANELRHARAALLAAPRADRAMFGRLDSLTATVAGLELRLRGDPIRQRLNENTVPSIAGRLDEVISGHWETRQAPTTTQRRSIEVAASEFAAFRRDLTALVDGSLVRLRADLTAAGAPHTPGSRRP